MQQWFRFAICTQENDQIGRFSGKFTAINLHCLLFPEVEKHEVQYTISLWFYDIICYFCGSKLKIDRWKIWIFIKQSISYRKFEFYQDLWIVFTYLMYGRSGNIWSVVTANVYLNKCRKVANRRTYHIWKCENKDLTYHTHVTHVWILLSVNLDY